MPLICAAGDAAAWAGSVGTPVLWALSPETCLSLAIVGVLLAALALPRERINFAAGTVAFLGLLAALVCARHLGGGATTFLRLPQGLLVVDHLGLLFNGILFVTALGTVLVWFAAADPRPGDGAEFFTLLLGATLGMSIMAGTDHLLMVFLGVELASLPSYVLAGFRKTDRRSAEAALKYVLFGAAATAVMAYGLSVLYAALGTLRLPDALAVMAAAWMLPAVTLALFAVFVGLAFKLAAVPVHFWCPDVFEGAGAEVAAFLSIASKGAALVLVARLTMLLGNWGGMAHWVASVLGIAAIVTTTLGNVAALAQSNVKRLLAYSSIAQSGYMLCLVALLGVAGEQTFVVLQALMIYLAVYLLMNLGAFAAAGMVERERRDGTLAGMAGLGRAAPITAACMTLFMLSLVGLPPLVGFNAKLYLLIALGRFGMWGWVLASVVVVNTVISAFYYLRVVRAMYLTKAEGSESVTSLHPAGVLVSIACATALVALFIVGRMPAGLFGGQETWVGLPGAGAPSVTSAR